jgi:hypothetical protein
MSRRLRLLFFSLAFSAAAWGQSAGGFQAAGSDTLGSDTVVPGTNVSDPNTAVAEQYAAYAAALIEGGQLEAARAVLLRAADYTDVSSDISYLLALVCFRLGRPQTDILAAARLALETRRWNTYQAGDARLLETGALLTMRSFSQALRAAAFLPENADTVCLRLRVLAGLGDITAFRRQMREALTRYGDDSRFPALLFTWAEGQSPNTDDEALIASVLRRLPALMETAPELAILAAPFVYDVAEARRLLEAYRATIAPTTAVPTVPRLAFIPVALNLGVIDEEEALARLFAEPSAVPLDRRIIVSVGELLRTERALDSFRRNLLRFSGLITEDRDRDGVPEAATRYENGLPRAYRYDANQDGTDDLTLAFNAGELASAKLVIDGEAAELFWGRYPEVREVVFPAMKITLPRDTFRYTPVTFSEFGGENGLRYPEYARSSSRLTLRALVSAAIEIERPAAGFSGAVERIVMRNGAPERSRVFLEGALVSDTEFERGRPVTQRIDLDLDGRLETRRRFRLGAKGVNEAADVLLPDFELESSSSDWDGDGVFEYREVYEGNRILRHWDMDGDGVFDTGE